MKFFERFGGIRSRILINNFAFFCIFVGIIIIVHSAFINVETSLTRIIDRNVDSVIRNAGLGRELTTIFASTQSVVNDVSDHQGKLRHEGVTLLEQLHRLMQNMLPDASLHDALDTFAQQFGTLLDQAAALADIQAAIQTLQDTLVETTRDLEDHVENTRLFSTLDRQTTPALSDQLSLAITRYREMILQIQLEFATVKDSLGSAQADPDGQTAYAPLFSALAELNVRLRTLEIDDADIAAYGTQLRQAVDDYMAAIREYQQIRQQTHAIVIDMAAAQDAVLRRMQAIDETTKHTANTLQGEISRQISASERIIFILAVVFLGVVSLGWWNTMRMIHPLQALSWCAEQLANGDINTSVLDIRTGDEISRLSQAFKHLIGYFHDMAHAMTEISKGNLELSVTPHSDRDVLGTGFQRMTAYLNDMGRFATCVAQGNLDSQITLHSQRDQLGHAFAQMQTGLIDLIREIRAGADQMAVISQHVLDASSANSSALGHIGNAAEVTSSAMRQVSSSVDEVRMNTSQLSKSVEDTSTSISEMITSITHVAENSRKLADFAEDTRETMATIVHSLETVTAQTEHSRQLAEGTSQDARYGQEAVAQMITKITTISDVTQQISQTVTRLENRSVEIGTILDVINDVADQTALLALNASIIAAQAGDHGRGFAVVAGEIKELANRVATSTKEIAAIVQSVQQDSSQAVGVLANGQKEVRDGVLVAREAGEALQKIAHSAQNSSTVAAEIAVLVRQQTTASNKVAASIQDVADMVKEIRGATQEQEKNSTQLFQVVENMQEMASQVARATGEQQQSTLHVTNFMEDVITLVDENMVTVKQLAQSANELAAQADALTGQVQRFVLPA